MQIERGVITVQDLVSLLTSNGYNPYSMPDRDFVPLAVLRQNEEKKFERVGLLQKFAEFPKDARPPELVPLPPENKAEFSSVYTNQIDASIGAGILKNIFSAMNLATDISAKISFNKVKKVELSYGTVISEAIDPTEIAAFLDAATPVRPGLLSKLLEPNKTFVAYDALKSDSFSIRCHAAEKADAVTEVNVLKNVIKTESKIDMTEESDTSLAFRGPGFQTFATRVYAFWIEDDGGKRSFLFQKEPPTWFERAGIIHRPSRGGMDAGKEHKPAGKLVRNSWVLPEGSFYRF